MLAIQVIFCLRFLILQTSLSLYPPGPPHNLMLTNQSPSGSRAMSRLPKKVTLEFTAAVGAELVLFRHNAGQAICLNPVSAVIWNLCDGRTPISGIAEAASLKLDAPVTTEVVQFALQELRNKSLLEEATTDVVSLLSRRDMVQRLGKSAAVLLPIVGFVAIPRQAHASGGGCVAGDTSIQLAHGGTLPMDQVRAGMWLRAFDAHSGKVQDARVDHVRQFPATQVHTLFTERGDVLQSSPSHLIIAGIGDADGTPVSTLKTGDSILAFDTAANRMVPTRLTGVHISHAARPVYGVEMDSIEHTYVAAGLVSHNLSNKVYQKGSDPNNQARAASRRNQAMGIYEAETPEQRKARDESEHRSDGTIGWQWKP
jgi:hypothetical protein